MGSLEKKSVAKDRSLRVFSFDSKREMLTEERTRQIFEEFFKEVELEDIEEIRLGGKSLDLEAAQVIAEILPNLVNLKVVSFADIIAGRKEEEGHGVLRILCSSVYHDKLGEIDLSDNALGAKGIEACKKLLTGQKKLEVIKFCNNGLAADAIQLLVLYLLERGTPTCLKTIHFFNNLMESEGARKVIPLIESSPALEDLRLASLRVGVEGMKEVIDSLLNTSALKKLDLSDNMIGQRGATAFGRAISYLPKLETLILRDVSLGDAGAETFLRCLERSSLQLKVLDLSCNELTSRSCRTLARVVKRQTKLERLLIEENELGSTGVRALADALSSGSHTNLMELNLAETCLGVVGVKALFCILYKLPSLNRLNLDGNWIPHETIEELERSISLLENKNLSVSFNDNETEEEEEEEGLSGEEESESDASQEEDTGKDAMYSNGTVSGNVDKSDSKDFDESNEDSVKDMTKQLNASHFS
eukprot:jgi/Galph1/4545/GphlegSOOS_G3182.1